MSHEERDENHKDEKWREDFPTDIRSDQYIVRRDFLRYLTVVSGGLTLGAGGVLAKSLLDAREKTDSEATKKPIDICDEKELQPGSWLVFHYPPDDEHSPAILIRKESGEFIAYSQKCPHLSCPVAYHRSTAEAPEHIGCHCHRGKFELATGKGVAGPPKELRPLRRIELNLSEGRVKAMGFRSQPRQSGQT